MACRCAVCTTPARRFRSTTPATRSWWWTMGRRVRRRSSWPGLPCSGLIYAEASWTQATEDWLGAHVRLFAFLDGVPAKAVPDNLKVGVTHASP